MAVHHGELGEILTGDRVGWDHLRGIGRQQLLCHQHDHSTRRCNASTRHRDAFTCYSDAFTRHCDVFIRCFGASIQRSGFCICGCDVIPELCHSWIAHQVHRDGLGRGASDWNSDGDSHLPGWDRYPGGAAPGEWSGDLLYLVPFPWQPHHYRLFLRRFPVCECYLHGSYSEC